MAIEIRESEASKQKKAIEAKLLQKVKLTDEEIEAFVDGQDAKKTLKAILRYLMK